MGGITDLLGIGGKMKEPAVPMPPPAAHPPTLGSSQVALAGLQARQKAMAAEGEGFDDTVGTSPQGDLSKPDTAKATLLGQ